MNAEEALNLLEFALARDFTQAVTRILRKLPDRQINDLYLLTHTDDQFGEHVSAEVSALMPIIEQEFDLRRDLAVVPRVGPIIAPDLYVKGGAYDLPF